MLPGPKQPPSSVVIWALRCVMGDMESWQVVEEAEEDGSTVMLMVMSMCCCCQAYKWCHFLPVFGCANVIRWSVRRPRVYKPLLFITLSLLLLFLKSHLYNHFSFHLAEESCILKHLP